MNNHRLRTGIVAVTTGIIVLWILSWLWSYALSFQAVTFEYDDTLGYIELTSDTSEPLYPPAGEEVRLKKTTYQMQAVGDIIDSRSEELVIDSDSHDIRVDFAYTRAHLDNLYSDERPAIMARINTDYPQIETLYTITGGALYGRGDIFGAQLVATTPSDNSDTLRIMLQKKSGKWRVLSKPPTQVLSVPVYPQIDTQILRAINQAQ